MAELSTPIKKPQIHRKKKFKKRFECMDCGKRGLTIKHVEVKCGRRGCPRAICLDCSIEDSGFSTPIEQCAICDSELCKFCTVWSHCEMCMDEGEEYFTYCSSCEVDLTQCYKCGKLTCKACCENLSKRVKIYNGECHNCIEQPVALPILINEEEGDSTEEKWEEKV